MEFKVDIRTWFENLLSILLYVIVHSGPLFSALYSKEGLKYRCFEWNSTFNLSKCPYSTSNIHNCIL